MTVREHGRSWHEMSDMMLRSVTFSTERERRQTCQELNSEAEAAVNLEVKCGSEARAHVEARTTACCVRRDGQYVFSALSDASVELLLCSITRIDQ